MQTPLDEHVEKIVDSPAAEKAHGWLQSRNGLWMVAVVSFFESALPIPIITDPFMSAAILANRARATQVIIITIASSLLGGIAAFITALFAFEFLSSYMTSGLQQQFTELLSFGESDTLLTTIVGAITPVPYTITAWVIAVAGGSFWLFLIGSFLGRSVRYGIVGYCTYLFGPMALQYARRSLGITSLVLLVLVGLYIWFKF